MAPITGLLFVCRIYQCKYPWTCSAPSSSKAPNSVRFTPRFLMPKLASLALRALHFILWGCLLEPALASFGVVMLVCFINGWMTHFPDLKISGTVPGASWLHLETQEISDLNSLPTYSMECLAQQLNVDLPEDFPLPFPWPIFSSPKITP